MEQEPKLTHTSERVADNGGDSQPIDTPESRGEALRRIGLAAAAALSVTSASAEGLDAQTTLNTTNELVAESVENQTLKSVLSPEALELLERNNLKIFVEQDSKNGRYVIFFGQFHENPQEGIDRFMTNNYVRPFQDKIYEVLPIVAEASNGVVYTEGIADTVEVLNQTRDNLKAVKDILEKSTEKPLNSVADASRLLEVLTFSKTYSGNEFIRNYDALSPELLAQAENALQAFVENFSTDDEVEAAHFDIFKVDMVLASLSSLSSRVSNGLSGSVKDDIAAIRLFMEDKIQLAPAEDKEANEAAQTILKKLTSAREPVKNFVDNYLLSDPTISSLREQLKTLDKDKDALKRDEITAEIKSRLESAESDFRADHPELDATLKKLEDEYRELVMLSREAVVFNMIDSTDAYGAPHVTVLYGNAHNFLSELNEWNGDFGLIKIEAE